MAEPVCHSRTSTTPCVEPGSCRNGRNPSGLIPEVSHQKADPTLHRLAILHHRLKFVPIRLVTSLVFGEVTAKLVHLESTIDTPD